MFGRKKKVEEPETAPLNVDSLMPRPAPLSAEDRRIVENITAELKTLGVLDRDETEGYSGESAEELVERAGASGLQNVNLLRSQSKRAQEELQNLGDSEFENPMLEEFDDEELLMYDGFHEEYSSANDRAKGDLSKENPTDSTRKRFKSQDWDY